MAVHLQREQNKLKKNILAMSTDVAENVRQAVTSLSSHDEWAARRIIAADAERSLALTTDAHADITAKLLDMANRAQAMLAHSLDSLINADTALAREVCVADDEVDALNTQVFARIKKEIRVGETDALVHLLLVARHLERIADHATNISEHVIYMLDGEIVRHKTENYAKADGEPSP